MFGAQVRREDHEAVVPLKALQQVGDLDVRVPVRASVTSERFPKSASASSKKSTMLAAVAAAKKCSRFFSVSPMYFERR